MPSFRNVLAAAAIFVSSVRADYVIDPDSVSLGLRTSWCQNEQSSCPLICEQTATGEPIVNTCDPELLTYGCVCSDNKQPNISEYSLTLPFFVCQEWGSQCVTDCGSDSGCASDCRENHPCGALNPTKANTTSSSTATATETGASATDSNVIYTGLAGQSDSNADSAAVRLSEAGNAITLIMTIGCFCVGMLAL